MGATNAAARACAWLADHREWAIAGLRRLVGTPSMAGQELAAQRVLADLLAQRGVDGTLVPLDEAALARLPGYSAQPPGTYAGRPNLVARLGGIGGGRGLLLNSHIDVVTPGDPSHWRVDPWSGQYRNGRIYGRGSADAKGCVWAAALAICALAATGARLRGDLVFESVVDEEATGNGTLGLSRRGSRLDGAVVLEPTGLHVCYGHRGVLKLQMIVPGQAGHGATRDGVNAIVKAAPIILALDALNDDPRGRLDQRYAPLTVNIGEITGGIEAYTIAPSCTVICTVRYPPGAAAAAMALLAECIGRAAAADAWLRQHPCEWTTLSSTGAAHTDPDGEFIAAAVRAFSQVRAVEPPDTFPATCDARHLTDVEALATIIWGPGELRAAHSVDESIEVEQVLDASMMLVHLATAWCA
jgi:acetylornithine deacetylase